MPPTLANIRVLVVEDHSDSREVLSEMLQHVGAVVRPVAGAEEALPFLNDVDVIVTDFSMPGKDGVWLLDRIRASNRQVPVILVSGFSARQVSALAKAPFDLKLLTPIDPWDLAQEIVSLLRKEEEGQTTAA